MSITRRRTAPDPPSAGSTALQIWRITTAARVFVLATAAGHLVATGSASALWTWVALGLIAAACCVAELPLTAPRTLFVPLAEGLTAVTVLMLGPGPVEAVGVYLVLPALVAGVRLGGRAAGIVTIGATTAVVLLEVVLGAAGQRGLGAWHQVFWVVVGLGAGLLAANLTLTVRRSADSQAPYAAAQRLLAEWDRLLVGGRLKLDLTELCRDLQATACAEVGASRSTVWLRDHDDEPTLLAVDGPVGRRVKAVVTDCLDAGVARIGWRTAAFPLRSGETTFGAVCLDIDSSPTAAGLAAAQSRIDEHAFRLQTALVLDGVRCRATADERHRLARDLHDGVAQRLAVVAHLSDEIAAESPDDEVVVLADHLRHEVVKVVEELRSSVRDLRENESDGLSATLSAHIRELSRHSPLRVHLSLDEQGERLPLRTEAEVARIACEAISNVHQHARAVNLWVTLTTDDSEVRLTVADDGVGSALPRPGHFGLHTMRERAELVGAELSISDRPDGGTVVALRTGAAAHHEEGSDDDRLARR